MVSVWMVVWALHLAVSWVWLRDPHQPKPKLTEALVNEDWRATDAL